MYVEILNKSSKTSFMTVRFGNVLDSEGSVVPLFREQIKSGGPITVTHPDVTRYFMTIPEACQLIIQACTMGNGGEIYVLDMGEPIKINFLAEQMIKLSGLIPGKDIEIVYKGMRPGEKMYEELFYETETRNETGHKKIYIANHSELNAQNVLQKIDTLINKCISLDDDGILAILRDLVPLNSDSKSNIIPIEKHNVS
jgi:FlaA1/EpsC-like NDP-sugar epimerase